MPAVTVGPVDDERFLLLDGLAARVLAKLCVLPSAWNQAATEIGPVAETIDHTAPNILVTSNKMLVPCNYLFWLVHGDITATYCAPQEVPIP